VQYSGDAYFANNVSVAGGHDLELKTTADAGKALERCQEGSIGQKSASERLYGFKITPKGIEPPIWRRTRRSRRGLFNRGG
jgi:hypothetical protein